MTRVHLHKKDINGLKKQIKKYLTKVIFEYDSDNLEYKDFKTGTNLVTKEILDIFIGFQFTDVREEE